MTDDRRYFRPVKIRGVILYESGRLASTFSSDRNMNYVNYRAQVGDFSEKVEIAEGRKFLSRVPSRVRAHLSMDFADKFQKYASRWKPEMTSRQVAGFGNFGSRDTTDEAGRQPLSSALTLKPPQLRALLTLGRTLGGGGGGRGCARARATGRAVPGAHLIRHPRGSNPIRRHASDTRGRSQTPAALSRPSPLPSPPPSPSATLHALFQPSLPLRPVFLYPRAFQPSPSPSTSPLFHPRAPPRSTPPARG